MLIAINRDFMLESLYKSKKINIVLYTIDALNLTSLSEGIYSIILFKLYYLYIHKPCQLY